MHTKKCWNKKKLSFYFLSLPWSKALKRYNYPKGWYIMLWVAVIPYFYYGTNQTIASGATLITIPLVSMVADFLKHSFLPPANEVWGKVIFSATCVLLFGRECLCMMSLHVWLPGSMFLLGRGVSVPGPMFRGGGSLSGRPHWTETPPYGEERVVCILLECFLVDIFIIPNFWIWCFPLVRKIPTRYQHASW